jgi:glucose-6-phosphate isomerase
MTELTEQREWQALKRHQEQIASMQLRACFAEDQTRFSRFSLEVGSLFLDYSRNRISDETLELLTQLATVSRLKEKINALMSGASVNVTENRAALHTALRNQDPSPLFIKDQNVKALIASAQEKMRQCTADIHSQRWRGVTGKPIKHIVNIGIGGSYLGPKMLIDALADDAVCDLQFHFISSVDAAHRQDILQHINPEQTLFIISSKSFTTLETMTNAKAVIAWMQAQLGVSLALILKQHVIAITAAADQAKQFGIAAEHIFPIWDFVGGRYSIWSAMGLPLMLKIGAAGFQAFLNGAYEMDQHFSQAPWSHNMPVLLALLGIWYMNFFDTKVQAIVPYAHRLRYLIPYLQQAEMESNGKNISLRGKNISYATSAVIFGEEGCNGQHAYHQLLHQGQHLIPVDFILVAKAQALSRNDDHDILIASALSQAKALMWGKTESEAYNELIAAKYSQDAASLLAKHQVVPGNRPSNLLVLQDLSPHTLGALIALYEHKIFVQGAIWEINSFDQWGVELGKQFLPAILQQVRCEVIIHLLP